MKNNKKKTHNTNKQKRNNIDFSNVNINRKYKDNLFRLLFKDKNNLLSLYNALNNTAYTNTNLLEVTTIENFIYMEMKNDVSFMLDCTLNLFEHQSSNNPNMPLRGLFYFAQHYGKIVSNKALHNHTLIKIPTPRYVVFYNGKEQLPERKVLRLSDAFYNKSVEGSIEVEATIININYGKNKDIMDKCKVLFEYSTFIQIVREYVGNVEYSTKEIAINEAIQYCIEHGILARLLREHRAEVIDMFFSEYTLEDAIEDAKIEARENAIKEVRETVIKEVRENVMKEAKEIAMKEAREEVRKEMDEKDQLIAKLQKELQNNK